MMMDDLDKLERDFRDVDMLSNIMIINIGHVEIDKYKKERGVKYAKMLKEFSLYKLLGNNDLRID